MVKKHGEEGMDMPVLRDALEMVYVSSSVMFSCDVEAGRRSNDWLGYCMLRWLYYTPRFLAGSKIWRDATKIEQRHQAESRCPLFVGWHNQELFLWYCWKQ